VDRLEINGRTIELLEGDITAIPADAIVNAANSSLAGGGGVDGAIHRAGGSEIMADLESRYGRDRHCPTGSAVLSAAGRLPARWVIHAVGPRWRGGDKGEAEELASAYRSSLRLAAEAGARSVSMPGISLGIYGYPVADGARIAIETVIEHLRGDTPIERIVFVLRPDTHPVFGEALAELAGGGTG
jgi:O-acetyl-ADP-ribose deacetylase (regulator of RNase III)